MKSVLLIASENSAHLICEIPRLFKNAGYRVTVLAFPHWALNYSSYIDEVIDAPPDPMQVIKQAADLLLKRSFDLKILASDALNWALVDSEIDLSLKAQLSSITNPAFFSALSGKVETAQMWSELNILAPAAQLAHSLPEAAAIAVAMGFPVMLKVSRSWAGEGVFKCFTEEEILRVSMPTKPFLVQKYIEGDLISVEPLFLHSRLAAYSYSHIVYSSSVYSPSLERIFQPCPEIEPILHKLGEEAKVTGFASLSFIREAHTNKHYLIESDFRPNRWIRHGEIVGVDWSRALRDPSTPLQRPLATKKIRHFPADLWYAVKTKQIKRILYWMLNRNRCWSTIPYRDLGFLRGAGQHFICRIFKGNYERIDQRRARNSESFRGRSENL